MGLSTYICPVPDKATLTKAIRDVITHNTTPWEQFGEYTDDEYKSLEMAARFEFEQQMKVQLPHVQMRCREHWSRGGEIVHPSCLVCFEGCLWLQMTNTELSASTMDFLRNKGQLAWERPDDFTPERKQAYKDGRLLARADNFRELVSSYPIISACNNYLQQAVASR